MSEDAIRLIDLYLDDVRRYLPKDIAADVVEELRTHILDKCEELGGLTVENVYKVIKELGPPEELARRYMSIGSERSEIIIRLGISDDLYPYFARLLALELLVMLFFFSISLIHAVTTGITEHVISVTFGAVISMIAILIFTYLVFLVISNIPEVKEAFKRILDEILSWFGLSPREYRKGPRKVRIKQVRRPERYAFVKREPLISVEVPRVKVASSFVAGTKVALGLFLIAIAYWIYLLPTKLSLNDLTSLCFVSLTVFLTLRSILIISEGLYELYTERKSKVVGVLSSVTWFVFIPVLILINLYTEQLQVPKVTRTDGLQVTFILIPSEYIPLVRILCLIILILIIVDFVIAALKIRKERELF